MDTKTSDEIAKEWVGKTISKPKIEVEKINVSSISSVKQRVKFKPLSDSKIEYLSNLFLP